MADDKLQSAADKLRAKDTGGTSVAATQMKTFQTFLEGRKGQLTAALPKHLNAERFSRLIMTTFTQNPKLLECEVKSVWGAIISAAQLGLEIGVSGQAYMIPYKGKATFVPGWQGLVDLVSRSGRGTVWTGAVFEGDDFDWALGDSPFIKHRPCGEDDWRLITHVYSVGRVNNAQWPIIEVWPISRVWKHRDKMNKVGEAHYSFKHQEMYARKIPLMQVLKYMPKSVEVAAAVELANKSEEGKNVIIDGATFEVVEQHEENTGGAAKQESGSGAGGNTKGWEPTAEEKAEIKAREKAEADQLEKDKKEGK